MPVMTPSRLHAWWADLRHNGLVVAPALLEEVFPGGPDEPKAYSYQRLRERYTAFESWCQRIPFGQYLLKGTLLFAQHQCFHAFQVGMRQVPL